MKLFFMEYFKKHPCSRCPESDPRALCFHHLDPARKDFDIKSAGLAQLYLLKKEMDKCIVLCSNCHNKEHYKPYDEVVQEYAAQLSHVARESSIADLVYHTRWAHHPMNPFATDKIDLDSKIGAIMAAPPPEVKIDYDYIKSLVEQFDTGDVIPSLDRSSIKVGTKNITPAILSNSIPLRNARCTHCSLIDDNVTTQYCRTCPLTKQQRSDLQARLST